jgi:hypothetical protein
MQVGLRPTWWAHSPPYGYGFAAWQIHRYSVVIFTAASAGKLFRLGDETAVVAEGFTPFFYCASFFCCT